MRYWTIVTPDYNILWQEYNKWETLSEKDILDYYWDWWSGKMKEVGKQELISEERCIEDWCVVHWAERNYWRELKENMQ